MASPKTLEELAAIAGGLQISLFADIDFKEYDLDELMTNTNVSLTARVRLRKQLRELKLRRRLTTAHQKFEAFLFRVGGADALVGLDKVPVSRLPHAVSFIRGPTAPSKTALARGVVAAYAKADALLARGPDPHGLTRDEIAAVNLYTQDGWDGPTSNLFGPLNASLRGMARTDVKIYWGYIRLLQHALFKLPKDESGTLIRGIRMDWPGAPSLADEKARLQQLHVTQEPEIWWGFSSTSTSMPAVERFLGHEGPRVIFTVDGGSSARDVRR